MDETEEIKRRLDIVDFIGNYLELKRTGQNHKALCPFHHEKTPSFMVNRERQIYKCFGCNKAGDVFDFLMEMEGLEFIDALKLLAERTGVKLAPRKAPEKKLEDLKSRLFEVNLWAMKLYHKILVDHPKAESARQYLKDRGIKKEIISEFKLGFAPRAKVAPPFLLKKGFSDEELKQAGSPDRFFNRIMFPIFNSLGAVTGFSGRVLDPKDEPKYLNTPETPIFRKSRTLYGLNFARPFIKKSGFALLTEGQMDVILAHQAGLKETVATSGTALTADHLVTIRRLTSKILFAFDNDEAGIKATIRAIEESLKVALSPRIVEIGKFKDLGQSALESPKALSKTITKAIPALEWYINRVFQKYEGKPIRGEQKKSISQEVLKMLASSQDPIEQSHYLELLASRLGSNLRAVQEALTRIQTKEPEKATEAPQREALPPERLLVAIFILHPELLARFKEQIPAKYFEDKVVSGVYQKLIEWYNQKQLASRRSPEATEVGPESLEVEKFLEGKDLKEAKLWLLEAEYYLADASEKELLAEVLTLIARIKSSEKEKLKSDFARMIAEAELKQDRKKVKKLLAELQQKLKEG